MSDFDVDLWLYAMMQNFLVSVCRKNNSWLYQDLLGIARMKCLLTHELGNIMCYCTGIFPIALSIFIHVVCCKADVLSLVAAVPAFH